MRCSGFKVQREQLIVLVFFTEYCGRLHFEQRAAHAEMCLSACRTYRNVRKCIPHDYFFFVLQIIWLIGAVAINCCSCSKLFPLVISLSFSGLFKNQSRYRMLPPCCSTRSRRRNNLEQELATPILSQCHGIFTDWSIFNTPFLLWKKGSSGPVTQWRQLVSCDWLWHSHGSLIQSRFDLKINRSMKTPWQKNSWVACSCS